MISILALWAVFGLVAYVVVMDEFSDVTLTNAQRVFLYLGCGPFLWVYGIWLFLGTIDRSE